MPLRSRIGSENRIAKSATTSKLGRVSVCRVTCVLKTLFGGLGAGFGTKPRDWSGVRHPSGLFPATPVCVECLIGKQKKPILFKVTEPSSIPYRTHPACAKMAAYPDPPPVILVP